MAKNKNSKKKDFSGEVVNKYNIKPNGGDFAVENQDSEIEEVSLEETQGRKKAIENRTLKYIAVSVELALGIYSILIVILNITNALEITREPYILQKISFNIISLLGILVYYIFFMRYQRERFTTMLRPFAVGIVFANIVFYGNSSLSFLALIILFEIWRRWCKKTDWLKRISKSLISMGAVLEIYSFLFLLSKNEVTGHGRTFIISFWTDFILIIGILIFCLTDKFKEKLESDKARTIGVISIICIEALATVLFIFVFIGVIGYSEKIIFNFKFAKLFKKLVKHIKKIELFKKILLLIPVVGVLSVPWVMCAKKRLVLARREEDLNVTTDQKYVYWFVFSIFAFISFMVYAVTVSYIQTPLMSEWKDYVGDITKKIGVSGIKTILVEMQLLVAVMSIITVKMIERMLKLSFPIMPWYDRIIIGVVAICYPVYVSYAGTVKGFYCMLFVTLVWVFISEGLYVVRYGKKRDVIFASLALVGDILLGLFLMKKGIDIPNISWSFIVVAIAVVLDLKFLPMYEEVSNRWEDIATESNSTDEAHDSVKISNSTESDGKEENEIEVLEEIIENDEELVLIVNEIPRNTSKKNSVIGIFAVISAIVFGIFVFKGEKLLQEDTVKEYKYCETHEITASELLDYYDVCGKKIFYYNDGKQIKKYINRIYSNKIIVSANGEYAKRYKVIAVNKSKVCDIFDINSKVYVLDENDNYVLLCQSGSIKRKFVAAGYKVKKMKVSDLTNQ